MQAISLSTVANRLTFRLPSSFVASVVTGKIVFETILKIENNIAFKTILKIVLQNTFEYYFENRK